MRPDLHIAMRRALALGPDHCAPDLFAGAVTAIISGLKAHSATITEARHRALEETFPRTRRLIGEIAFGTAVEKHFARPAVTARPIDELAHSFPDLLSGDARHLANIEWAWLQAYGARDAPALMLHDIAGLDPGTIVDLCVTLHPATRLVTSPEHTVVIDFDGKRIDGPFVLVTRPGLDVQLVEANAAVPHLVRLLDSPRKLGELLNFHVDACALLLTRGALHLVESTGT